MTERGNQQLSTRSWIQIKDLKRIVSGADTAEKSLADTTLVNQIHLSSRNSDWDRHHHLTEEAPGLTH